MNVKSWDPYHAYAQIRTAFLPPAGDVQRPIASMTSGDLCPSSRVLTKNNQDRRLSYGHKHAHADLNCSLWSQEAQIPATAPLQEYISPYR